MQLTYNFNPSIIPVGIDASVDLLLNFTPAAADRSTCRPLNLSLVIDRSGSMAGTSLRYAIKAAQSLVAKLTSEDFLSVIIYDDTVETIFPHSQVTEIARIQDLIAGIRAGGCTNLSGGWLRGCEAVKSQQADTRLNRVLLLTDGQANAGITNTPTLIDLARQQAAAGITTTTLGFNNYFNEDLLIGMANAGDGNFYFIQSPDDGADVFRIELESLTNLVAQNLNLTLTTNPGVTVNEVFNNYRSTVKNGSIELFLGDVYANETKQIALSLNLPGSPTVGKYFAIELTYNHQSIDNGAIVSHTHNQSISIELSTQAAADSAISDLTVVEQIGKFKIAKVKEEAIALADKGEFKTASTKLKNTVADPKLRALQEASFEVAEELAQLDHYARQLESNRFTGVIRKEMLDQAYQAQSRDRSDLKLRGIAGSSASTLDRVSEFDRGVLVECVREGGKLRIRVVSEGYDSNFNVQFPRDIRQAGVTYIVDEIQTAANGSFYRAIGKIRCLVRAGEENLFNHNTSQKINTGKKQKADALSLADLESTDTVGDGVLLQCLKDKSKLRIRVVSDGYNPDFNIRFPRSVREEGTLYVVDEVEEVASGGSYIAYGKIRRFVQQV